MSVKEYLDQNPAEAIINSRIQTKLLQFALDQVAGQAPNPMFYAEAIIREVQKHYELGRNE
jgi:hypothetical protein